MPIVARRRQREPEDRDAHKPEEEYHRRLASHAVAHPADYEGSDGSRDEARAEGGERCQQACRWVAGRKESPADVDREKREGQEIVELQCIPDHNGRDIACRNRFTRLRQAIHHLEHTLGHISK